MLRINLSTCELHGTSSNIPLSTGEQATMVMQMFLAAFQWDQTSALIRTKMLQMWILSLQLDPTDPGTMAKESAKDPVIANVMCFTREG